MSWISAWRSSGKRRADDPSRNGRRPCRGRLLFLPELQNALDPDPLNWKAALALAKVAAASDKRTNAEPLFRKAIEIGKDHCLSHADLTQYRFRRADYAGALREWNMALRITPDNANVLLSLGATYHMLDRDDEAAAAFQGALEIARRRVRSQTSAWRAIFIGVIWMPFHPWKRPCN